MEFPKELFLEEHQKHAEAEYNAAVYMLGRIHLMMSLGRYKEALIYTENLNRSLKELEHFRDAKRDHDKLFKFALEIKHLYGNEFFVKILEKANVKKELGL